MSATCPEALAAEILGKVNPAEEWTTLRITDLVEENIRRRRVLYAALDLILRKTPGHVAPVHTSEPMATFGCRTSAEHRKRLRRLHKLGGQGPWISHLRIHRWARQLEDIIEH